jgi:8-oxo-dGTP pyrophosphatase MutT (NUDIX family)
MVTYTRYIPTNQKISNNDDFLGGASSKEGAVGSNPTPRINAKPFELEPNYTDSEIQNTSVWVCSPMRLPQQIEAIEAILFKKLDKEIQYLLLKRTPESGGFWQPITGGIDEGETKIQALRREIGEETGIKNFIRIIRDVHRFEFFDPHLIKEYAFGVQIHIDEEVVLDKKEHSEYRWCNFHEALRLLRWKENKEALRKLHEALISQTKVKESRR